MYLFKYLRHPNRQPFALLVGAKQDNQIIVSWSRCHKKDQFCKTTARLIALDRLQNDTITETIPLPKGEIENFKIKCLKYFKMDLTPICQVRG